MAKKKKLNYEVKPIKSLEDFIREVSMFKKDKNFVWYRGHSDNSYKLEPSIYRKPFSEKDEEFFKSRFKSKAIPYLSNIPFNVKNDEAYWEWMFIMQHYKIPTRLLDWTESALIGLAFAVMIRKEEKEDTKGKGAHVWCIDPLKVNANFPNIGPKYIPNITESEDAQTLMKFSKEDGNKLNYPMAIYGPQNSSRIVGQKGVFTVFPSNYQFNYDDYITSDIGIKLEIPNESNDKFVKEILEQLYIAGISESIIYPELDSVSKEIINELKKIKEKL